MARTKTPLGKRPQKPRATAAPVELTLRDIEAKAAGGRAASAVTKRIRAAVPTKALGRLSTKAAVPTPISAKEMAEIVKRRNATAAVRKRIVGTTESSKPAPKKPDDKLVPTKHPRKYK